jgi:8-oxo-dGTP diphosphatase
MNRSESSAAPRIEIAIAVVEREGRYLIGLREEVAALAGYWEFPGGKIDDLESPEAAAVRECLEETGLVVRVTGKYPAVVHDYEHGRVRLHFMACASVEQRRALPPRFRWVPAKELVAYQFPPANRELLDLLSRARQAQHDPPPHAKNRER